ncbi:hypothetical protein EVAR_81018_1 [Eumeta japonica]|uniref:Uncharacterized protein n=1 Tax=Eumeta variegata TaxID=151549 RepID=A0A4C1T847_EUMVA|nr:hypothetical protein EVAR_81018_1 [Eumeta japonica]
MNSFICISTDYALNHDPVLDSDLDPAVDANHVQGENEQASHKIRCSPPPIDTGNLRGGSSACRSLINPKKPLRESHSCDLIEMEAVRPERRLNRCRGVQDRHLAVDTIVGVKVIFLRIVTENTSCAPSCYISPDAARSSARPHLAGSSERGQAGALSSCVLKKSYSLQRIGAVADFCFGALSGQYLYLYKCCTDGLSAMQPRAPTAPILLVHDRWSMTYTRRRVELVGTEIEIENGTMIKTECGTEIRIKRSTTTIIETRNEITIGSH